MSTPSPQYRRFPPPQHNNRDNPNAIMQHNRDGYQRRGQGQGAGQGQGGNGGRTWAPPRSRLLNAMWGIRSAHDVERELSASVEHSTDKDRLLSDLERHAITLLQGIRRLQNKRRNNGGGMERRNWNDNGPKQSTFGGFDKVQEQPRYKTPFAAYSHRPIEYK